MAGERTNRLSGTLRGRVCHDGSAELPDPVSSPMRIALVAPHPDSRNGIGDYTGRLVEELRLRSPRCSVMAPADFFPLQPGRKPGDFVDSRLPARWPRIFLEAVDAARPQLVHIQHGLYAGHGRSLSRFLDGLRARRIPCVMTLHGVWPPTAFRRWPASFYRLLASNVDQVIIHQRNGSLSLLQEHGIRASHITVIPHGTWTSEESAPVHLPDTTGLNGRRVVLFAGNIFRRKGLHVVIQAFPDVLREIPDACLLVVGSERTDNVADRLYLPWLHHQARRGLKGGWLIRRAGYVSDDELWARIAGADVVVFPYLRRYGSSSGIFHRVLAAGQPAICARVPTFAEATEAWGEHLAELFPPPGEVGAWSRSLIRILSDEPLRRRAMEASATLGRETSWSLVARNHLQLYRSLISPAPIPDVDTPAFHELDDA